MTSRLTTERDGELGIWLSRPGVDVFTAAESDLLLSSNFKNFQFVAKGVIAVSQNQTVTVFFGFTLPTPPAVWCAASDGGRYVMPSWSWLSLGVGGDRAVVTSFNDRITIYNQQPQTQGTAWNAFVATFVVLNFQA